MTPENSQHLRFVEYTVLNYEKEKGLKVSNCYKRNKTFSYLYWNTLVKSKLAQFSDLRLLWNLKYFERIYSFKSIFMIFACIKLDVFFCFFLNGMNSVTNIFY